MCTTTLGPARPQYLTHPNAMTKCTIDMLKPFVTLGTYISKGKDFFGHLFIFPTYQYPLVVERD